MRREGWRRFTALLIKIAACAAVFSASQPALARSDAAAAINEIAYAALPPEAQQTLQLIRKGGPYPYQRDGVAFGNYAEFATWLEILAGAAIYWQMQDEMFVALLDAKTRGGRKLKTLPG